MLFFLTACKDVLYEEKPLSPKTEYEFSGRAELGTPLSGSHISALKFHNLQRGEKIGETLTHPDGTYQLKLSTDYDGPVLLVVNGGTYRDLTTKDIVALKPGQELTSAITHIKMPETTNINAWTTMAVARVVADRGFWDKSIAELAEIERINVDFNQMSYFLTGKSPAFINIRRNEYFDREKDTFNADDPRSVLHLANGGLSKLAHDYSISLAEEGILVSMADLLSALVEDLSDRRFDGRNAIGNIVFVGKNRRINLNSYTMRKYLSESILLYSQQLKEMGKINEEERRHLEMPGSIVDMITKESKPELFPEEEKPLPIDKEAPTLRIHFSGDHNLEQPFSFLSGNVSFDVEAHDDTKVQEIRMLEPKLFVKQTKNNYFGPILVNHPPQALQAAEACGQKREFTAELEKRELSLENVICACFEATDIFKNSKKELTCFQRATPKAIINFPTAKTVLSKKSFAEQVKVKAKVVGGLPIADCAWHIELIGQTIEEGVLPQGKGNIEGTTCSVDELLESKSLFNGNYRFVIEATDIGGRVLKEEKSELYQTSVDFQVFMEPPSVELTSPNNNAYLATDYIPVFGVMQSPEKIKSIEVKYKIASEADSSMKAASVSFNSSDKSWSAHIGSTLPAGEYVFETLITDIYGNEKTLPKRTVTIDKQSPTIYGAVDGVPQWPYLQESIHYRQRFVDEPQNPHYVVEPVGQALPISWQRPPKIHRWLTRIGDQQSAPRYSIRATDDNKLKAVRYRIHYKCSSLEDTTKDAQQQDDRFTIYFTQSSASFDLGRDSELDGHTQNYCLSIWAIDDAGNATNHNVEFIWKVVSPPLAIQMNPSRYRTHNREDDLSYVNKHVRYYFQETSPLVFKKDVVVGHSFLFNPHNEQLRASFALNKGLYLKIPEGNFDIPSRIINVRYFAYDMNKDAIGPERAVSDQSIIINPNEVILATFILAENLKLPNTHFPSEQEWKKFRLEVGFVKNHSESPTIDGISLTTKDLHTGEVTNSYKIPWEEGIYPRKRSSPRVGV